MENYNKIYFTYDSFPNYIVKIKIYYNKNDDYVIKLKIYKYGNKNKPIINDYKIIENKYFNSLFKRFLEINIYDLKLSIDKYFGILDLPTFDLKIRSYKINIELTVLPKEKCLTDLFFEIYYLFDTGITYI